MPARQSAEVQQAMRLVIESGKTVYEAATMTGLWPSTIYRALKTKEKKKVKKYLK